MSAEAPVLFKRLGSRCVSATLHRPKALNALNLPMIRMLEPEVAKWSADPSVAVAVFEGTGPKAFCAGGDIKTLYECRNADGTPSAEQVEFFAEEYALDDNIAKLKDNGVQQVVFYDGITMGGGVGVSIHAPFRIATEATVFAMPETAIGFFPDVGGSFFLPRLPNSFGMYLALTGARVKGAEAVTAGLASHFVPRDRLDDLRSGLGAVTDGSAAEVESVVSSFSEEVDPAASSLGRHYDVIGRTFNQASVEAILDALRAEADHDSDDSWAAKCIELLGKMSPTSLAVTHRQLVEGSKLPDLPACLHMELFMAKRFMEGQDFYEGVRTVLVDKGDVPRWQPLADADVDSYFPPSHRL